MNNAAWSVPPLTQLELGDWVLEKYQIEKVLGAGAMGIVYRALHADLERYVAVKVVRPELLHDASVVARMLNEARAAAQLSSEYAVRVLDVGQLPSGYPFIVMEYLDGEDLRSILERGAPFELERAVDYVLQACSALAEAHQCGIVHRDLKPENLFLTRRPDGTPIIKVFDFGISKQVDRLASRPALTQANTLVGSPYYMAPEQMQATEAVDGRADVWSLGVLLHELVTQTMPFEGEAFAVICANVLNKPAASVRTVRPELPEAFARVVLRCLEKSKEQRFASVLELKAALEPFSSARHFSESGVRPSSDARSSMARGQDASYAPAVATLSLPPALQPKLRRRVALASALLGGLLVWGYWSLTQKTATSELPATADVAAASSPAPEQAAAAPAVPVSPTALAPVQQASRPRVQPALSEADPHSADPRARGSAPVATAGAQRRAVSQRGRGAQATQAAPAAAANATPDRGEPAPPNPFDPNEFGGRH